MTPAEELRSAAARMRELAAAAPPGGWDCLDRGDRLIAWHDRPDSTGFEYLVDEPVSQGFGQHAAHWDPTVALAVAAWLEQTAHRHTSGGHGCDWDQMVWPCADMTSALAVARAFMGGAA